MTPAGRHRRIGDILADLRREIMSGAFRNDDMLPGERELAARFAVSRTTLRRLLADLVAEGLLRHRQGVGTFIARADGAPLSAEDGRAVPRRLAGLAEEMMARGVVLDVRDIERQHVLPTPDEAMMLASSPDEPVVRLTRLRSIDDVPLAVERVAVPARLLGTPAALGPSLYAALAARGHVPVRALQRVQATDVGMADAALLGVAAGRPGVMVRRTAYLADGPCCEFTRSIYPADRYDAMTEVRAPSGRVAAT